MTTKADIRQHIRQHKAALAVQEREELSRAVVARLEALPQWAAAQTVLLYHSLPDEVNTHALIQRALLAGKRVLLPVVTGDELELRTFSGKEAMTEGCFHIQEPTGTAVTDFDAITLAVIPGVAFTAGGRRLGRGKGYYDRLLPLLKNAYKVGLCWPFQMVDSIPCEAHDIPMDAVVTATRCDQ